MSEIKVPFQPPEGGYAAASEALRRSHPLARALGPHGWDVEVFGPHAVATPPGWSCQPLEIVLSPAEPPKRASR